MTIFYYFFVINDQGKGRSSDTELKQVLRNTLCDEALLEKVTEPNMRIHAACVLLF